MATTPASSSEWSVRVRPNESRTCRKKNDQRPQNRGSDSGQERSARKEEPTWQYKPEASVGQSSTSAFRTARDAGRVATLLLRVVVVARLNHRALYSEKRGRTHQRERDVDSDYRAMNSLRQMFAWSRFFAL